jgi:hypothetical protein
MCELLAVRLLLVQYLVNNMKNTIIGIAIGIMLTITIGSVYLLISQNSRINSLEVFASHVATMINNAQKAQTK